MNLCKTQTDINEKWDYDSFYINPTEQLSDELQASAVCKRQRDPGSPDVLFHFGICSTRNYTVPDPPGLFDGHVWPMYLKHRKEMEDGGVDVGKPP